MGPGNGTSPAKNTYVLTSSAESDGTYVVDEVAIPPASVVRCIGKGDEGDGYKVSRQWVFRKKNLVFTLYDWKSTDLYESGMWSPESLWQCEEPFDLHIGSKVPATETDVEEFIAYIREATSPAKASAKKTDTNNRILQATWCKCPDGFVDPMYMPDRACPCGVEKHHYHCLACRGISQVG